MSIYSDAWEILKEKPISKPQAPRPMCNDTKIIVLGSGFGRIGAYTKQCYCVSWDFLTKLKTRGSK